MYNTNAFKIKELIPKSQVCHVVPIPSKRTGTFDLDCLNLDMNLDMNLRCPKLETKRICFLNLWMIL